MTLTGAGGSGKSRLSLRLAHDVLAEYPDGVWWVELRACRTLSLFRMAYKAPSGGVFGASGSTGIMVVVF